MMKCHFFTYSVDAHVSTLISSASLLHSIHLVDIQKESAYLNKSYCADAHLSKDDDSIIRSYKHNLQ